MVADSIISLLNWLIENVADMLSWAILLLPSSPVAGFLSTFSVDNEILKAINYFIPLSEFMPIASVTLTAYGVARGIWALMRIGKVVD